MSDAARENQDALMAGFHGRAPVSITLTGFVQGVEVSSRDQILPADDEGYTLRRPGPVVVSIVLFGEGGAVEINGLRMNDAKITAA